jgi:hypothetical protein
MSSLILMRLAVKYAADEFVKCQEWDAEFIRQTAQLVFSADLMKPEDRKKFLRPDRDWRRNPCLVRYRNDGHPREFICQRGERGPKVRRSEERGEPLGIEFWIADTNSSHRIYHFNTQWLRDTAALTFRRQQATYNNIPDYDIKRIAKDRTEHTLNIQQIGTPNKMPWESVPDFFPCGYPRLMRRTWN